MYHKPAPAHLELPRADTPLSDAFRRADVQRLFVHDNAAVCVPGLRALHGAADIRYAERAVLLAQPGDAVVVERPLEFAYQRYLDELGIGPGTEGIVALTDTMPDRVSPAATTLSELLSRPDRLQRIVERLADGRPGDRPLRLSTYYPGPALYRFAEDLEHRLGRPVQVDGGSAAAVHMANRKDLMRAEARRIGVPWPSGCVVALDGDDSASGHSARIREAAAAHCGHSARVLLRGIWSAHGVDALAMDRAGDPAALATWLAQRPEQRAYLVESLLEVCASPNVQVWIEDDGSARLVGTTRQRLYAGLSYGGSAFPHRSPLTGALEQSSLRMANHLSGLGYRGLLGLDFIESRTASGEPLHHLVEVNGRINGATYALALAEGLNRRRVETGLPALDCWQSRSPVDCRVRSFAELADRIPDLLYRPGSEAGVVPYNVGCLPHGFTYLLSIGPTPDAAAAVERQALAGLT